MDPFLYYVRTTPEPRSMSGRVVPIGGGWFFPLKKESPHLVEEDEGCVMSRARAWNPVHS